ncbi:MAG: phytoene/squalene synthase family protein [Acidobacteriales bacterium]|nr:phytoene/squalene synthase family protein [Terriglobales bacterium]
MHISPSEPQLAVAYSVCRRITRASAKNFYYAFLLLPRSKRRALCAIYAFMWRCDDIADDINLPLRERRQKLSAWLDALHRAHSGVLTDDPVLLAVTDAQRRYQIPIALLDQLAQGTAMDLREDGERDASAATTETVAYRTFDDLYLYCYRVASVVGLVSIRIFGYRDPEAELLAERCGVAFQLTNIIRDVKEDAAAGRVYLPEEDLQKFGISADQLRNAYVRSRLAPLLKMEADRAREYYRSADLLIPMIDEDCQPALWALVTIYRRLLEKIARRNYDVYRGRTSLTRREKLAVLAQGFVKRLT